MKKLILLLLLTGCECQQERCGTIVEIVSKSKHGYVMVKYGDELVKTPKRRPKDDLIGTKYCECIKFKGL